MERLLTVTVYENVWPRCTVLGAPLRALWRALGWMVLLAFTLLVVLALWAGLIVALGAAVIRKERDESDVEFRAAWIALFAVLAHGLTDARGVELIGSAVLPLLRREAVSVPPASVPAPGETAAYIDAAIAGRDAGGKDYRAAA